MTVRDHTVAGDALAMSAPSATLLRWVLRADAIGCGVIALAYFGGGSAVSGALGIPFGLLMAAGAILALYGVAAAVLSMQDHVKPAWIVGLILVNGLWAIDSALIALSGWFSPTGLGVAWHLAQIVIVVGFGALQYIGMRKATS